MKYMKRIALDGANNFRDLGGIPCGEKSTCWGKLYRSDSLAHLSEADLQKLEERNIKTVIDLRSENEAKSAPLKLPAGAAYYHYNLMKELDSQVHGKERSVETILKSMQLDYVKTIFGNMECGAGILREIRKGLERGAVVFLCSAGKDRTGITAAMVLYLAGVKREDILADYMISSVLNTDAMQKLIENFPIPEEYLAAIPDLLERVKTVMESRPETMDALLNAFNEKNLRAALADHGFGLEEQAALAELMTE